MRADLVPDGLWERLAPLLPPAPERRHRHPSRLRVPDRAAFAGVIYVLRTGVAWRDVPAETVGCSGVTAWRRLRDWTEAGVWPRPPQTSRAFGALSSWTGKDPFQPPAVRVVSAHFECGRRRETPTTQNGYRDSRSVGGYVGASTSLPHRDTRHVGLCASGGYQRMSHRWRGRRWCSECLQLCYYLCGQADLSCVDVLAQVLDL